MKPTEATIIELLRSFQFKQLFLELNYGATLRPSFKHLVGSNQYNLTPIAQLGGLTILEVQSDSGQIPPRERCAALDQSISALYTENLLIFVNQERDESYFQKSKQVKGKRIARGYRFFKNGPIVALARGLERLSINFGDFDLEGNVGITTVTDRFEQSGLFADAVTKEFFKEFNELRREMLRFLNWIEDESKREWYCSVLLNRLMFIFFIAERGFLPGGRQFLRDQLASTQSLHGEDSFYSHYLLPLCFFGLGEKEENRGIYKDLFRNIVYLNGGLFTEHSLETELGITKKALQDQGAGCPFSIPDKEFSKWIDYLEGWRWTLDEKDVTNQRCVSPHILGYIFEKYINGNQPGEQKAKGAYYTKEDITGYICRNTIVPRLFDMLASNGGVCEKATNPLPIGPHPNWLNEGKGISQGEGIERYIFDSVRQVEELPTETASEYAKRQVRFQDILRRHDEGSVGKVDDFVILNLDLNKLAVDFIATIQDPVVLHTFYFRCIRQITVLDPTCGSGAFLYTALNTLFPVYEAALKRMRYLVGKGTGREPDVVNWRNELHFDDDIIGQGVFADASTQVDGLMEEMRHEVEKINAHTNPEYFIRKTIIVNNLFGVDIMEEATEVCKLRLFLTLIATAEYNPSKDNYGIEPLPDIDFNIRCGNALIGFASASDINRAFVKKGGFQMEFEEEAAIRDHISIVGKFRRGTINGSTSALEKQEAVDSLNAASNPLNRKLAQQRRQVMNAEFVTKHKPFHWVLEFGDVLLDRRGFDVIVGNPPWREYSAVKSEYEVFDFETIKTGNLYALMTERCLDLLSPGSRFSFIVQLPIVSSSRMQVARDLLNRRSRFLTVATFDDRPGKLFDGLENCRSTIFTLAEGSGDADTYVTRYHRWPTEFRDQLVKTIEYARVPVQRFFLGALPKISTEIEASVFNKLLRAKSIAVADLAAPTPRDSFVFYQEATRYWIKATVGLPGYKKNGVAGPPDHGRFIYFDDVRLAYSCAAILNSSLFYAFFVATSDCFHLSDAVIRAFPVSRSILEDVRLQKLGESLMNDLHANSEQVRINTKLGACIEYEMFFVSESKKIIDEIDDVLGFHFSLSEEELSYVKGFDEKYRMSDSKAKATT